MKNRDIEKSVKLLSLIISNPSDVRSWVVSAALRVFLTDKDKMVLGITVMRSLTMDQFIAATDKVQDELSREVYDEIFRTR